MSRSGLATSCSTTTCGSSPPGAAPNSVLAAGYDLKVFFTIVGKDPVEVTTTDVLDFIAAQRFPVHGGNVVRLEDGEKGLSARTIARRLATLSGLYGYLLARDLVNL